MTSTPDGQPPTVEGVLIAPPAPPGFDAFTASRTDLQRHGLPQRPDPDSDPFRARLWEQTARRYADYQHLEPKLTPAPSATRLHDLAAGLGPSPRETCGYSLATTTAAPFTILTGTWTVPNLNHAPTAFEPVTFHTFLGLGFLDVHVEMTVDTAQTVTAAVRLGGGAAVNLPVRPGDTLRATLCLQTDAAGTASFFLANETTAQTVNFTQATHFPPAVTVDAGISRSNDQWPFNPLARFGVVYFDELTAWTTQGTRLLTNGTPITMVDDQGKVLAQPFKLDDNSFKIVWQAS